LQVSLVLHFEPLERALERSQACLRLAENPGKCLAVRNDDFLITTALSCREILVGPGRFGNHFDHGAREDGKRC